MGQQNLTGTTGTSVKDRLQRIESGRFNGDEPLPPGMRQCDVAIRHDSPKERRSSARFSVGGRGGRRCSGVLGSKGGYRAAIAERTGGGKKPQFLSGTSARCLGAEQPKGFWGGMRASATERDSEYEEEVNRNSATYRMAAQKSALSAGGPARLAGIPGSPMASRPTSGSSMKSAAGSGSASSGMRCERL
jgi:hypothetical protein